MRVVVTGAAGFIGWHLVRRLSNEHEVWALTRSAGTVPPGVREVEWDLALEVPRPLLPPQADAVVHLAQSRHYRDFPERADDIFSINVAATAKLLDYARAAGARQFVLASTGGVYGYGDAPFTETDAPHPHGYYAASKHAAETLVEAYSDLLHPIVLRFFFVYGPRQKTSALIPSLAARVLAGEQVVVDGALGLRMNPIHVADAVEALCNALSYEGSLVCNVAGQEEVTVTRLVDTIAALAGRRPVIHHTAASDRGLVADTRCLREVLGVTPVVTLRSGLTTVLDDLRA